MYSILIKKRVNKEDFPLLSEIIRKGRAFIMLTVLLCLSGYTCLMAQNADKLGNRLKEEQYPDARHFKSLVSDLHPSICLVKGKVNVFGSGTPTVLECDAVSTDKLYSNRADYREIEMIRITLESQNDEMMNLDLSKLKGFQSLKYILVVFGYDACGMKSDACLTEKAGNMVHGTRPDVEILYVLSIPE